MGKTIDNFCKSFRPSFGWSYNFYHYLEAYELFKSGETLKIPINFLNISVRARNALRGGPPDKRVPMKGFDGHFVTEPDYRCVEVVGDLLQFTERELLSFTNFSTVSLNEVKSCLKDLGLSLKKD